MIPLRVLIQMLLQGSGKVAIFTLIGISVMQGFEMLVQIVPPCEILVTYPTIQHIFWSSCAVNILVVVPQIVFPCEAFATERTMKGCCQNLPHVFRNIFMFNLFVVVQIVLPCKSFKAMIALQIISRIVNF